MKKGLICILSLMMVLGLGACSSNGGKTTEPENGGSDKAALVTEITSPISIEFWHNCTNIQEEIVNQRVEEFNSTIGKEKGITVTAINQGSSAEVNNKVVGAVKAKNAPAVVLSQQTYVEDLLASEAVVDLTPYINDAAVGMTDYDDIYESFRTFGANYSVEGTYSLPFTMYTEVLYYNQKFFETNGLTVPTTWEELAETSAKIQAITGNPAFGTDYPADMFITLTKQFGGDYTNVKGELLFNSEAAIKALTYMQENIQNGNFRLAGEDMFFSGPFANGIVPMYIGRTVESQYISSKIADPEQVVWASAAIPQADAANKQVISNGYVLAALNQSGNAEQSYAAYEFIKFMSSKESNLPMTLNTGYLPIRQSVVDDAEYKAFVEAGTNDTKISGPAQSDAYFFLPAFSTDDYTSSAVYEAVKTMMDEVLVNFKDPAAAIEACLNSLK